MKQSLFPWLAQMPAPSIERLRHINLSTTGSHHIILALGYALYDSHIRKLNRLITSLLLARMRAERNGNERSVERINKLMNDLHSAIDSITGTTGMRQSDSVACVRASRGQNAIAQ
jgi:hypothetical protein